MLARCLLPFVLSGALTACEGSGTASRAAATSAAPPALTAPVAAVPSTPDTPSVRIDRMPSLVPREQCLKPRRRGSQIVIDSDGKWQRDCAIHHECGTRGGSLPMCAIHRDAESWETMAKRAEHFTDPHVFVRGRLLPEAGAFSTAVACQPGVCCNHLRAGFVLEGPPTDLELDRPACVGDESRLCCSILAEGQEVVATGDLQFHSGAWRLANASLCRLAD